MSQFYNNAIFWVEVDKIKPNPFQPRREFDEAKLNDLARSIRQYGVIQPLTVTRREIQKPDGGIATEYELVAGERRLRASKIAGVATVPALIRETEDDDKTKLELAIVENLQREDLNPVDRAKAFEQLVKEFGFKHVEVAEKVGKSREYVSNSIRLLALPQEMLDALMAGKINEGHTRPLLMLADRPEEQNTLFREVMLKRLTVRDTEAIARRIAYDKVRKKEYLYSPEILDMEKELGEALGTRVAIETKENGGKLIIDFMGEDDLRVIFSSLASRLAQKSSGIAPAEAPGQRSSDSPEAAEVSDLGARPFVQAASAAAPASVSTPELVAAAPEQLVPELDDRTKEEKEKDENTFDPNSFSI
ncbi:MAG: ParB/RepB/Spo0J family partition protein [Candidatus Pacebacteria bacterium]|nr:ParB/RepB/Spo0J family partition protein [Candidatus Paceibacterota bacterium]